MRVRVKVRVRASHQLSDLVTPPGMTGKPFPVTPVGDLDMADCDLLVSRYRLGNTHRCPRAPAHTINLSVQEQTDSTAVALDLLYSTPATECFPQTKASFLRSSDAYCASEELLCHRGADHSYLRTMISTALNLWAIIIRHEFTVA